MMRKRTMGQYFRKTGGKMRGKNEKDSENNKSIGGAFWRLGTRQLHLAAARPMTSPPHAGKDSICPQYCSADL